MRIDLKKIFILFVGVLVFSGSVYAQRGGETQYASPLDPSKKPTPIYFGPAFGFNIMGHSTDIPTFEIDPTCPNFKNATGLGIYGGLTLEYLFGDVTTSSSSMIFRVLYNMYPGSVSVESIEYPMYNSILDAMVNSNLEHTMDIDYNAITFEAMYKINPIPGMGLGIVVGPAIDYIITKNRTQKSNITKPNNAQFDPGTFTTDVKFENNYRTVIWYSDEIEEASTIRFGIKAGVQYEILLGSKLYIAPSVAYNFGIISLTSKYTWRVSPLQIGIDARFAF
jgi:hypothetical protein